jgi:spore cortex formation protein SpoVR/YcgB (stage V sporulation)
LETKKNRDPKEAKERIREAKEEKMKMISQKTYDVWQMTTKKGGESSKTKVPRSKEEPKQNAYD